MIKIDKNNFEEINTKEEFYIHDSIIHELRFDYQQKSIDFLIEPEVENGEIKHIIFENVIGMEMITADLWGKSPHVFDFYSEKFHKRQLIPKIFRKMHELKNHGEFSRLTVPEDYIELVIVGTSGDQFRIACEYLLWE